MNLDLPLTDPNCPELDEYLSAIDREVDALFLDEVDGILERLRAGREETSDPAVA